MVAVLEPLDPNSTRELVCADFLGLAKRIASALQDKRGRAKRREMPDTRLLGLAGRMKRIAEANEAAHAGFIGDHARDTAAERLAADNQPPGVAEFPDRIAPGLHQRRSWVRRAALAGFAPPPHIRKFESRDADARSRDSFSDRFHERRIHRASRAMRENQSKRRGLRSV